MTTFFCLLLLDAVLWNKNTQSGIIAHNLDDASNFFKKKVKFAFDHLHPELRAIFRIIGDSAKELAFTHGSSIRVGTSLRSDTLQNLHISEFGKTCAKDPEKAREIVTGALNTVHVGQRTFIESTAEGKEGPFFDMVQTARANEGKILTPMDYKFFFFPWWKHPEYTLGIEVEIPSDLKDYFAKLYLQGIQLTLPQKWWYVKKWDTQRDDMHREFPSTPDEAFSASQDGYWFARDMKELYEAGRVRDVAYDRALPVHTASDLGQHDAMSIWFFQINRSDDINFIDFFQKTSVRIDQLSMMLKEKGYNYGTHIWPHDANARDRGGITFVDQARDVGLEGLVLSPHSIIAGINQVRTNMSKMWFDKTKCKEGLNYLQNYKKKWSSSFGGWTSEEVHDDCSHAAAAMRYAVAGFKQIPNGGSLENDYKATRRYFGE